LNKIADRFFWGGETSCNQNAKAMLNYCKRAKLYRHI
jgi:hypothetical protein